MWKVSLGVGGGGGLGDAQQRQFGKTRDRRKATWVKEMHEKVDWETQGYRKGKLGKQGTWTSTAKRRKISKANRGWATWKAVGKAIGGRMGTGQVPDSSEVSPVGAVLWADAPRQVLRQACQHLRAEISTAHSLHF